jgi:hypothetical protein
MNIKYVTHDANVNGTSLRGYVQTTYHQLVATFGPEDVSGGDKTNAEWTLSFIVDEDGEEREVVATIYDWKNETLPLGDHRWHVGGHLKDAPYQTMLIEQCLRNGR